jgi:hypothetical protein
MRAAVVAQLGHDPFGDGPEAIHVRVERIGDRLTGQLAILDAAGVVGGTRALTAADCDDLAPALELVLALIAEPWTGAAPTPPPAASRPIAVRPSSRARLRGRVGAALLVALDAVPARAALALGLQGALVHPRWSLGLELRGVLPAERTMAGGGTVEGSLLAGLVSPCVRHRVVSLCLLVGAGYERGGGSGLYLQQTVYAPWVALGGRVMAELPFAKIMALQGLLDVLVPLTRSELYVGAVDGGQRVYRTATVSSALGLAVAAYFP